MLWYRDVPMMESPAGVSLEMLWYRDVPMMESPAGVSLEEM